ncbi:hypothetical protein CPB84DRAFT_1778225 [Gymnopilus junonius]|uniref:Uncharacterized protein n=1 Tax=Gymnopilus junonius TaxID=109634 RepID=A0A9P5NQ37_GYMJU|nr:hypothetical protein CPB84DRAFT_1778225 [Gymnopilus junonius]
MACGLSTHIVLIPSRSTAAYFQELRWGIASTHVLDFSPELYISLDHCKLAQRLHREKSLPVVHHSEVLKNIPT